MDVGAGLYMYDVDVKSSRSLSHLLMSSCFTHTKHSDVGYTPCLKNVPPLVCYNFETCKRILVFVDRNVTDKVNN